MKDLLVEHSRQMIKRGSKSFAVASRIFDQQTRDHATLLYAWCRHCDDSIDGQDLGMGALSLDQALAAQELQRLHQQTQAALAGEATHDLIFAGFQRVMFERSIPARYALDHLTGFEMDVQQRRYETINDTLEYCYHVAGVVGMMMGLVMGVREEHLLRRACDLGIALQLTNIARDVFDDARGQRMYLPQQWLREAGIPPEAVTAPEHRKAIFEVVRRLLAEAEPYYESARWAIPRLVFRSAWAVAAAQRIYREIGTEVMRRGPTGMSERTSTTKHTRLVRALQAGGFAMRAVTLDRLRAIPPRPTWLWSAY